MPWLRPKISADPSLTWPSRVKTESVFTGTFTVTCRRDPEEFGSYSKACWRLFRFCASCFTPMTNNKVPTYLWIPLLLFWVEVVCCGTIFLFCIFSPGCLNIPCNDENIVKLWEGLFSLLIKGGGGIGDDAWEIGCAVTALPHISQSPHTSFQASICGTRF